VQLGRFHRRIPILSQPLSIGIPKTVIIIIIMLLLFIHSNMHLWKILLNFGHIDRIDNLPFLFKLRERIEVHQRLVVVVVVVVVVAAVGHLLFWEQKIRKAVKSCFDASGHGRSPYTNISTGREEGEEDWLGDIFGFVE
jgi:hypothetical protein